MPLGRRLLSVFSAALCNIQLCNLCFGDLIDIDILSSRLSLSPILMDLSSLLFMVELNDVPLTREDAGWVARRNRSMDHPGPLSPSNVAVSVLVN